MRTSPPESEEGQPATSRCSTDEPNGGQPLAPRPPYKDNRFPRPPLPLTPAVLAIVTLVLVFTFVNIRLVHERDLCQEKEINRMVLAKILDASNCAMVYGLDPHHNCTRVFMGGACTGHPGESVYLFRSESGECDFKSHDEMYRRPVDLQCSHGPTGYTDHVLAVLHALHTLRQRLSVKGVR